MLRIARELAWFRNCDGEAVNKTAQVEGDFRQKLSLLVRWVADTIEEMSRLGVM